MSNPVLVEVMRGDRVESRHAGAVAVLDPEGGVVFAAGDIDAAVYPRSAVKGMQALPLIESGAADRFGLTEAEIALACASHSGEPAHVALAASMLERAGMAGTALECGAHWPNRQEATIELAEAISIPVIASGGLASIDDVKALLTPRAKKLEGAISGRALYDGRIDPAEALKLIRNARTAA